jgi:hypothetical protein
MEHLTEQLIKKWAPVLDHKALDPITDNLKKSVTATILETTEKVLSNQGMVFEGNVAGDNFTGNATSGGQGDNAGQSLSNFTPILISLIRRSIPQLIAFDTMGVQPLTMPTGLIFALRSGYANTSSAFTSEALFNEANSKYSGKTTATGSTSLPGTANNALDAFDAGIGITTAAGESDAAWPQMGFTIEKTSVDVQTRRLRADYTLELAQDLKAVHNLDAESELSNILSTEILGEINREGTRIIYTIAKPGGTNNSGAVNINVTGGDINGRYFAEQWRGLQFLIERDCIAIAKETRRGKGNFIIVDAETASALSLAGILDYSTAVSPQASLGSVPDETTSTFAGTLGGRLKVFVDPYTVLGQNFYTVGYKGSSPYDAGLFYCPYVPLQLVRSQNPDTFQPAIGFKTRYGMTEHPFSGSTFVRELHASAPVDLAGKKHKNRYYRISVINNLI